MDPSPDRPPCHGASGKRILDARADPAPPEEMSLTELPAPETGRRRFLALVCGVLAGLIGLALGLPIVGAIVGPSFRRARSRSARAAAVAELPVGQPVSLRYADREKDAYLVETVQRDVWALRHAGGEVSVFSPVCPHLGCRYDWKPAEQHFFCACHRSVFALDGHVLAGPSPRPLDRLPAEIRDGELLVEWQSFVLGIAEKKAI